MQVVTNCAAAVAGGGVFWRGYVEMEDSIISGNKAGVCLCLRVCVCVCVCVNLSCRLSVFSTVGIHIPLRFLGCRRCSRPYKRHRHAGHPQFGTEARHAAAAPGGNRSSAASAAGCRCKVVPTKHKTQNTKHKTQNTKHKTQHTKHKTKTLARDIDRPVL